MKRYRTRAVIAAMVAVTAACITTSSDAPAPTADPCGGATKLAELPITVSVGQSLGEYVICRESSGLVRVHASTWDAPAGASLEVSITRCRSSVELAPCTPDAESIKSAVASEVVAEMRAPGCLFAEVLVKHNGELVAAGDTANGVGGRDEEGWLQVGGRFCATDSGRSSGPSTPASTGRGDRWPYAGAASSVVNRTPRLG